MQFMNNVKFGDRISLGANKYELYLGNRSYCVYKPLTGKAYTHVISNKSDEYTIESCLRDYFNVDVESITNINGDKIFQTEHKLGDIFILKHNDSVQYTVVQAGDKYTWLRNFCLSSKRFDSVDELVKQEFPSNVYIKKEN